MADEKQNPSQENNSGVSQKLILMISGVNLLITLAIIVVVFLGFQKETKKTSLSDISTHREIASESEEGGHGESAPEEEGKIYSLEVMTINLSVVGSGAPKFVRVGISIEVNTVDAGKEIEQKLPRVKNIIIDLFNSKRPADLAYTEGRNYLKEELRNALNNILVSGKVIGVFFTSFAMSS